MINSFLGKKKGGPNLSIRRKRSPSKEIFFKRESSSTARYVKGEDRDKQKKAYKRIPFFLLFYVDSLHPESKNWYLHPHNDSLLGFLVLKRKILYFIILYSDFL